MYGRTILIGDVHGCLVELEILLKRLSVTSKDTVIFLGDLVDKGPHSPETVNLIRQSGWNSLRGNHEDRYLRYLAHEEKKANVPGYFNPMRPLQGEHLRTFQSLTPEDWSFLKSCPTMIRWDDTILVHAGVDGSLPLDRQKMKDLLNLEKVGGTHWSGSYRGKNHVVYGHSPTLSGKPRIVANSKSNSITFGLDTGCVHGGALTAMIIDPSGVSFESVPARKVYSPFRAEDVDPLDLAS